MDAQTSDKRLWLGLLLVIIGGAWLLDNLNIIPEFIPHYFFSRKTFLILLGLYFLFGRRKPEVGIVMIAIGAIFLLQDMELFYIRNIWHIFWPAIVIIIGISLIMRRSGPYRTGHSFGGPAHAMEGDSNSGFTSIDYIDDFAIFGGRERTINSQNFRGGKLTAIFGGSELNMRNADLAPGTNVLDVFVLFGGTEISVPPDWTIHVEAFSLLGGFSDKRSSALKVVPNAEKVLVIKGFVMFGGGEIKL